MKEVQIEKVSDLEKYSDGLVFFLPLETRPKNIFSLSHPNIKKYWHTGIIYHGSVYETFDYGKFAISKIIDRGLELLEQKAVFVLVPSIDEEKLQNELKSGTSCDEYVLRCTNMSDKKGTDKGDKYPDDVYKLLVS